MIVTLLLSIVIVAIAVALLAVRSIARKGGHFPSVHIHDSAALRQRGIDCVLTQDKEERKKGSVVN